MKKRRIAIPTLIAVPVILGTLSGTANAAAQFDHARRRSPVTVTSSHARRDIPCAPGGPTGTGVPATAQPPSVLKTIPILGALLAGLPIAGPLLDSLLTSLQGGLTGGSGGSGGLPLVGGLTSSLGGVTSGLPLVGGTLSGLTGAATGAAGVPCTP